MRGHADRVEGHPAGGVGLLQGAAGRQVRTVDRADVVQAEESALEHVAAARILPVDPPGEVDQQLVEHPAEEVNVASLIDREHLERGPRLHRRVDVAEVPFVGRERPVRVLEPFPAQQDELVLGEGRIQVRERHAVKAHVPGGEPGVLPLVRHRHDVEGVKVAPPGVAAQPPPRRRERLGGITVQPPGHVEVVELLAPQQAREGLPHHHGLVGAGTGRCQAGVELVRFRPPPIQNPNELLPEWPVVAGLPRRGAQAQPQLGGGARREGQPVPERAFGALAARVDRGCAGDDVVVDAILRVRGRRGGVVQAAPGSFRFRKTVRRDCCRPGRRHRSAPVRRGRGAPPGRPRRRPPPAPAWARRRPMTRCCGTTRSAGHAGFRRPGRRSSPTRSSARRRGRPWRRRPRRSSTGHRRTRRCRAARIRAGTGCGRRSWRPGRYRGRAPGGSGSATGSRRGWAPHRGTTSTP